jgi:hypothetical protein
MAKSKAKSKAKTVSKSKKATLPSGYKVIGRAPNWEPEKHSVLEGVRGEAKEVEFQQPLKKGQKKAEVRTVRTVVIQDETLGAVNVWESGMLKDFFDQTDDGDKVRIEYLGLGKAKPGQNAPRLFSCGVAE